MWWLLLLLLLLADREVSGCTRRKVTQFHLPDVVEGIPPQVVVIQADTVDDPSDDGSHDRSHDSH